MIASPALFNGVKVVLKIQREEIDVARIHLNQISKLINILLWWCSVLGLIMEKMVAATYIYTHIYTFGGIIQCGWTLYCLRCTREQARGWVSLPSIHPSITFQWVPSLGCLASSAAHTASDTGSVCVFSGILLVLRGLWLLFSVSRLISSMNSVPLLRVLCLELSVLLFS